LGGNSEKALELLKGKMKNEESKFEESKPEIVKEMPAFQESKLKLEDMTYNMGDKVATRAAYGKALKKIGQSNDLIIVSFYIIAFTPLF
jgi:hypothetical protein